MNEIIINGVSIKIENLTIVFMDKEINIIEKDIKSDSYRFFRNIIWEEEIDKIVYLKDVTGKKYTFYDCYLGKNCISDCIKITIKFNAYITDYFIEDIRKYNVDKIEINLEYKKFDIVNIEKSLGKNIYFDIGKMHYGIELIFQGRYYKVILQNDSKLTTEKFIHKFLLFYEFLILNLGYYLEIKRIRITNEQQCFEYGYPFSSKYSGENNYNSHSCVLGKVNNTNIKQIYKEWLKVRRDSHIIYDIFLNVFSVKYFIEIALSTITNCMEGYYKCIHKYTLKKTIITKDISKKVNKDFREIITEYLNSSEGKIIFPGEDRKVLKIYTKLTNHRNYFAHLDKTRRRFYGDSNLYMLLKIKLVFRAFILNDINQTIENDNLKKCVSEIEKYIKRKVS